MYIDDILIFSKSLEDYVQHVGTVLLCLLEHSHFSVLTNSEFYLSSVSFLEYMISLDPRLHPVKTSAVFNWPVPDTRKQLQWFLGQFLVALHPELQLHGGTPHHSYQCGRGPACGHLRTAGVGVVLSQRATADQKLHPSAFFSCQLSVVERNYDIGNRKLLAVKLALEEGHHWLEGAKFPFLV